MHIYKVLHFFLKEMHGKKSSYSFFQSLSLLVFVLKHLLQISKRPKRTTENRSSRSNMYLWYHASVSEAGFKWAPPLLCRMCSTHWMSRWPGGMGWDLWILLRDKAEDLNLEEYNWLENIYTRCIRTCFNNRNKGANEHVNGSFKIKGENV